MLDAINLERMGLPAAVVAQDKLANTTGRGMARAQGYPNMKFAIVPYSVAETAEEIPEKARAAAPQVERILLGE